MTSFAQENLPTLGESPSDFLLGFFSEFPAREDSFLGVGKRIWGIGLERLCHDQPWWRSNGVGVRGLLTPDLERLVINMQGGLEGLSIWRSGR